MYSVFSLRLLTEFRLHHRKTNRMTVFHVMTLQSCKKAPNSNAKHAEYFVFDQTIDLSQSVFDRNENGAVRNRSTVRSMGCAVYLYLINTPIVQLTKPLSKNLPVDRTPQNSFENCENYMILDLYRVC